MTETTRSQIENMKSQTYGVEVEMNNMIQLCMAMSQLAKQIRSASPKKQQTENEAYAFRCWMLRLGFIGDEFKTARDYFMRNFEGNSAWRHAA